MEMLIVVAIIAILVAIAIPTFSSALEKAREAADIANIRSAYAEAMLAIIDGDEDALEDDGSAVVETVEMVQADSTWKYVEWPSYLGAAANPVKGEKLTVTISADGETVTVGAAE